MTDDAPPGFADLPWTRRVRARALARVAGANEAQGPARAARDALPAWLVQPIQRALAPLRLSAPSAASVPVEALPAPRRPRDAAPPVASVLVPTRGGPTLAQTLAAVAAYTDAPHEVVVIDDASPARVEAPSARVIRLESRRGFVGAANAGARAARTDTLVFLNDDAVVTPGWLTTLLGALARPRAGLVGPASNDSGDAATQPADYRDLPGLLAHAATCEGPAREVDKLSLLCAAIRRETFDRVGGLDEGYGLGMFEDDELCRQLRRRRLRVLLAPSAFVHHHGSRTFGALDPLARIGRFEVNRRRFERRWRTRWRAPV